MIKPNEPFHNREHKLCQCHYRLNGWKIVEAF